MSYPLHIDTSTMQASLNETTDIYRWRNSLPPDDFPQPKEAKDLEGRANLSEVELHTRSLAGSLFWPVLAITVPISLISASLLALVFAYQVKSEKSLFESAQTSSDTGNGLYILVNYSATRIVFAASFLSTLAPILGSFIMALWALPVAQMMRDASIGNEMQNLPTPYQLSLIIGLTLSSLERLRAYFAYACSRSRRAAMPPVLNRAAMTMTFSVVLAVAVFVTDTVLHYTTTTIEFDQLSAPTGPIFEYGRGLSARCADFNRSANNGLPCSFDYAQMQNNPDGYIFENNEVFRLAQNFSKVSQIRLVDGATPGDSHHAVLLPHAVDTGVDYEASTMSVATTCKLITDSCHMQPFGNTSAVHETRFQCSDAFYGVLGLDPVTSQWDSQTDLNVSVLSFKPSSDLQYAFFKDSALQQPYNPVGYSTARESSGTFESQGVPNDELVNPMYVGIASRFDYGDQAAGVDLPKQRGFHPVADETVTDFVLSCEVRSYDTDYIWNNGAIAQVTPTLGQNGSVLEIYQGALSYFGSDSTPYDLQIFLLQSALSFTPEQFETTWADLYSVKVMSGIGPYTSSRTNVQEQTRTVLLVAKVPKPALGALIACSLAYTVLGVILGLTALRAASLNIRELATQLSLPAIASAAFDEKGASALHSSVDLQSGLTSDSASACSETRRVIVDASGGKGQVQGDGSRRWVH